jgi:hypothetical protein
MYLKQLDNCGMENKEEEKVGGEHLAHLILHLGQ